MFRKGNYNIFAGDRAYQTNFLLNFKSQLSEQKFQTDTFLRTKYFLQGYVLICLIYLIWNFTNSTCFNFYHNCKHSTLLIISLLCLIGVFPAIKMKKPFLIGLLLLLPNLYIHLVLVDMYSYHLAIHFIVVQTAIANALIFHTWKKQLIFNILNYGLLALITKYNNIEFLVGGNVRSFLEDILLHHIIALILSAYIEKGRRERWVLLDTFKKSETMFMSLVENILLPVFVVDSTKRVLYANQHGQEILKKYCKNITGRTPLHKMNVVFSSLLANDSQGVLEKLLANSALDQESKAKIAFKEVQEEQAQENVPDHTNPPSNLSTLYGTRLEKLLQASNNIYQVTCTKLLWKKSYANLLCIQDITKMLKTQEVMSSNLTKLIDEARTYIESAEGVFENFHAFAIQNANYKSLAQTISYIDKLRYGLQNISIAYDIACGKFRMELEKFHIKEHIIYLLEILSVQTIKQKLEMKLNFEPSFPPIVTGDYLKLMQLLHNFLSSIIENCKEGRIVINCNMKCFLTEATYLLEFEIHFPKSLTLQFDKIKSLINEEYQQDNANNLIRNDDFESKLLLFKPLLTFLKGTSSIIDHPNSITVKFDQPSPSNKCQRRPEPIPSMEKFHLTNSRSGENNKFSWEAQPNPLPSPVSKLIDNNSYPSPHIMREKISEKIKAQLNTETGSVGSTGASKQASSANKVSKFQDYKKQQIRQNLVKLSGENLSSFASEGSSAGQSSSNNTPDAFVGRSSIELPIQGRSDFDKDSRKAKSENHSFEETKEDRNEMITEKIIKKKSNLFHDDNSSIIMRSPGIMVALEQSKAKIELLRITAAADEPKLKSLKPIEKQEKRKDQPEQKVNTFVEDNSQENPTLQNDQDKTQDNKIKNKSCQLERPNNQKKTEKHKRSLTISTPDSNLKANQFKPCQPSFFSPKSHGRRLSDADLSAKLRKESMDIEKNPSCISQFTTGLKGHEQLLKIAVSNVLIAILNLHKKRSNSFTLHISRLDIEKSNIIEEQDETMSPLEKELKELPKEPPSIVLPESENKALELVEIVKKNCTVDKLNADELLEGIVNYMSSRLVSARAEKDFIRFLWNYVKLVENKFKTGGSVIFDGEEETLDISNTIDYVGGKRLNRQPSKGLKINRIGSSESIFSMGSDMSNGDKAMNLTDRILMSPAVFKMLDLKHNPDRMMSKVLENLSGKDRIKSEPKHKKREKNASADLDKAEQARKKKKEELEKELMPFDKPQILLPVFITVRTEAQKRRWVGGNQFISRQDSKSNYRYFENFTILVVDDSKFVLDGIKTVITAYKKELVFSTNGLDAVKKFESNIKEGVLFHLILMDVMMPNYGGFEATRKIRQLEKEKGCPSTFICGLSNFNEEETKRKCLEAGMNDYCSKPIDVKKLNQFILSRCKDLGMTPTPIEH